MQVADITEVIPIEISITEKRRDFILSFFDRLLPFNGIRNIKSAEVSVDLSKPNERLLYYCYYNVYRFYRNSRLADYMKQKLDKGDIFVDVGANLGFYSKIAKDLNATVIAFEPEPNHLRFLKRNSGLYDRLYGVAVADKPGQRVFYIAGDDNPGASSLVKGSKVLKGGIYRSKVNVDVQTLDDLLIGSYDIDKIKLIKIDVEGSEEQVIRGMRELLKLKGPHIWCEVRTSDSDRSSGSYKDIIDFLRSFGYSPYVWEGSAKKKFNSSDKKQVFDLLFEADSKHQQVE